MKSRPVAPDSSPLILLGKLERVDLLAKLYGKVIVTPAVWDEAIAKGKAMGARDAAYLEKVATEARFESVDLTEREDELVQRFTGEAGIDLGEAETLAVAQSRNAMAILDDKGASALAVGLGVAHIGTAGMLFEAFLHRIVSYDELVYLLERLAGVAWISPELLAGIIRRAKEVEDR